MTNDELRAAILNRLRKIHYLMVDDYDYATVDICAECGNDYPCRTVLTLDGDLNA